MRAGTRVGPRPDLPGQLDNYYVPRGYAVVLGESIGTFNSDGCPTVGDRVETLGTKAVIDWLNGRARGFDADGNEVSADWTTGAVGMVGVSYNGTLPNQVATTGVEGLETIIPISAISSWYDYYRANGLVVAPHSEVQGAGENGFLGEDTDVLASFIGGSRMVPDGRCPDTLNTLNRRQDRVTGDYSPFWAARDYLDDVDQVRASVFVVHGLNDWNVKTKAFAEWWYRLAPVRRAAQDLAPQRRPRRPGRARQRLATRATENRWFDHELFGVQNGILSRAARDHPARGRLLRRRGRLACAGHEHGRPASLGAERDRPGHPRRLLEWVRRDPGLRGRGAHVRYRRRSDPRARTRLGTTGSSTARPRSPPPSASAARRGST